MGGGWPQRECRMHLVEKPALPPYLLHLLAAAGQQFQGALVGRVDQSAHLLINQLCGGFAVGLLGGHLPRLREGKGDLAELVAHAKLHDLRESERQLSLGRGCPFLSLLP